MKILCCINGKDRIFHQSFYAILKIAINIKYPIKNKIFFIGKYEKQKYALYQRNDFILKMIFILYLYTQQGQELKDCARFSLCQLQSRHFSSQPRVMLVLVKTARKRVLLQRDRAMVSVLWSLSRICKVDRYRVIQLWAFFRRFQK